ncbi:putative nepenthesin [Medicago truncatula]|uniref:Eukaryotic aspartyl protease family protein n=1 Tax=Medicago truncatula TaxID=3880 RepID=A0A072TUC7_MEDTR|nr:aspartic proteinase CDR1 [Medicago truncatula]KEH17165.1 eukaryotic aspartyl protease family protein [Medicago truncatula]RHN74471.1 putative nepenthesin [Medicago truncatula]
MHAFIFLFSALCSLYTPSFVESTKNPSGFEVELIHHDSPLSPFYNSSLTSSELITNAALRSISRSKRLSLFQNNELNESPESIIIPNGGDYLMKIYIGTPPVERLAVADTGSNLIWVQCSPCKKCFPQDKPYFDPNKSSTYMGLSCDSQSCSSLPLGKHRCGKSKKCEYLIIYGDESYSFGELSTDSIGFGSMNGEGEKDVTFPKSVFGCGLQNDLGSETSHKTTGIVGLGLGPLSLVSQLGDSIGRKFSYCLVPFGSNSTSKLKFGDQAIIKGNGVVSTPLMIKSSDPYHYYLNLEGITVGQKTAQSGQTDGNIIIDSGTTLTYLEPKFYNDFIASVKGVIGVEEVKDPPSPFTFCFTFGDLAKFPNFVFHFTGADVTLKPQKLLGVLGNNSYCLLAIPSNDLSIFGNIAHVDFLVEYDLEGKKVSFAPSDCSKN